MNLRRQLQGSRPDRYRPY